MIVEIGIWQIADEPTGAVPFGQQRIADGVGDGAQNEISTPEINRYLYENLASNIESQIGHWNRKAARDDPNPETAQRLRTKAEGLGYALRLLGVFEPEFRELTEAAIRFGSGLDRDTGIHRTPSPPSFQKLDKGA